MLYLPNTRANISTELPVASGSTIDAEGMALVASTAAGVLGAKASAGSSGEVFLGVAISQQMSLLKASKTEAFVQPAGGILTLAFTPSSGTVAVYSKTSSAVIALTTGYTISGKVITMNAATLGHDIEVTYNYVPNANQARALQGDIYPGGPAGAALGQIGVIRNGIVYTDQFDTTVDWNAANPVVKTAANGQFTIGGSGATLSNVSVLAAPTAGFPYLGLLLN